MPVKSYKMGPGTLNLGAAADLLDVSAQVRACTVKAAEKVERTDPIPVLSGEELAGDESTSYDWTITGNLIQDIDAAGVVDWSWTHAGEPMAFEFIPSTAAGRKVTGTLVPVFLDFGGDVDLTKRPESAFTWRLTGTPTLSAV